MRRPLLHSRPRRLRASASPGTESKEASPVISASPRGTALLVTHASLLLTAAIWGGNFAAMKFLVERLRPLDVVFLRGAGAAFFFAVALLLTGHPLLAMPRRDLLRLATVGLVGVTIMNLAIVFGQARLPAALASLIITSNPIHTAIISRVLLGEPLTRRKLGGIAVAFAGFLIVLLFGSSNSAALSTSELTGVGILAIAPFAWAFYTVLSKPLLRTYPPVHVAAYGAIVGSVAFLPLPLVRDGTLGRIGELDGRGWAAALFATLISFVLAYVLWYRGLRVLTPSQTAVYAYLVPVFGLLAAWLVLDERPTLYLLLGGATILAGVILTNSTPARHKGKEATVGDAGPAAAVGAPTRGGRR